MIEVAGGATETIAITVHDQDRDLPPATSIIVDFGEDQTGFFADPAHRAVVQLAADDWAYFLADPPFDGVPAGSEQTFIWNQDGFVSGQVVSNASAYTGFLLYAYGIHSSALRSGGEGSEEGMWQTTGGVALPLRRSGGLEVETAGNYNQLGWHVSVDADDWWVSGNLGDEPNDLYSIVHHEIGHAHGFSGAYTDFVAGRSAGLGSPAILAYLGHPIAIDASDHFAGEIDPSSGFGAFGNEYNGVMPIKRWIITRLDLMALAAIGYPLRVDPTAFTTWQDTVPDCP
jgi:hypothetical protein